MERPTLWHKHTLYSHKHTLHSYTHTMYTHTHALYSNKHTLYTLQSKAKAQFVPFAAFC